ncbi:MAG: septal ring lytic transglycosylase RlpA family protein [Alphaproteobacteria bacterium]|nr:septal ring lytic transglycosylase RlpA family protein [Alphaproteobacteria bacterium]MBV9371383.1 septal ring lytic transglycosylase RlpA family protein [Alphaproteobacteria bacterium]MBV9901847.1 septal ring lytic transglycosylase RlpA family protein [Alphaproteobacteria bacterium]
MTAAPGPAVAAEPVPTVRLQSLEAAVAALPETDDVSMSAKVEAVEQAFESAGQGEASYYGRELEGNRTASGERFSAAGFTAAHRTLPLGTRLRVTNLANGRSVIVRVNDRGPFVHSRLIDVSLAAAREINMVRSGKAQVKLEIVRSVA